MDFQIAGRKHVTTYQNKWGDENYIISKANKQLIKNWYRGRCFIHDSGIVEGEETETLTEVIVGAIKQYGVQVILIDNLMTAIGSSVPGKDKYEKQSEFCQQLASIARKWNVLILLVAHKRKGSFVESADINDDTSGSADITNLASITLSYDRGARVNGDYECAEDERILRVNKNRLFGRVYKKVGSADLTNVASGYLLTEQRLTVSTAHFRKLRQRVTDLLILSKWNFRGGD